MHVLRTAALVLVFGLVAAPGFAQATSYTYAFGGPAVAFDGDDGTAVAQGGAGVEGRFATGVAVGAAVTFLASPAFGGGFGIFSPHATYYAPRRGRFTPFVSGGYSLVFGTGGVGHGMNLGGGFEYSRRRGGIALRVEMRDDILAWKNTIHVVSVRVGATFRSNKSRWRN